MSARKIRALRKSYGLHLRQWAQLFGVASFSAFRWESGTSAPKGLGRDLLVALDQAPLETRADLGQRIAGALATGGTLGGLLVALLAIVPSRKAGASAESESA